MIKTVGTKVTRQIDKFNALVANLQQIRDLLERIDARLANQSEGLRYLNTRVDEIAQRTDWLHQTLGLIAKDQVHAAASHHTSSLRLASAGQKFFSQNDEDGIIEELFRRVGSPSKVFVEIGAGDGTENNTLYLLLQGWTGFWLECDATAVSRTIELHKNRLAQGKLSVGRTYVTAENILDIIRSWQIPKEPDLLSVDLDGNDYYILRRCLEMLKPRVIVVEYNAFLGPSAELTVPNDNLRKWNGSTEFGASLKAIEKLAASFDYSLVGCSVTGVNAFLVRNDLLDELFEKPFTSENHFQPFRFFQLPHHRQYPLSMDAFGTPSGTSDNPSEDAAVYCQTSDGNFFVAPDDQIIGHSILLSSEWEPAVTSLVKTLVKPGDLVVDVGANIGWYSVICSKLVGEEGHVFAVEPEHRNFKLLSRNILLNGCSPNVSLFECALGDHHGTIELALASANFGDHFIRAQTAPSKFEEQDRESERPVARIKCATMDDLIYKQPSVQEKKLRLVKIDTQGAEVVILRQGHEILKLTETLVVEYWPYGLQRLDCHVTEFWQLVERHFPFASVVSMAGTNTMAPGERIATNELKSGLSHANDFNVHYELAFYKR